MKPLIIGIDAGTSVVKVCVFDQEGGLLGLARERLEVVSPQPLWREVVPERLWRAVTECLQRALAMSGRRGSEVGAIGLTAAMVGAYVIDREGRALRNGITWDDGRTQSDIAAMEQRDPLILSRIFDSSGSVMQTGCTLPLLAWLLAHEPDTMRDAATVFGAKDYLGFRLTGQRATDRSEAAVAPGDSRHRTRNAALLPLFGLNDHQSLLPEVIESGSILGGITPAAAMETGLAAGTPVSIGAGDVIASLIGAGADQSGSAATILGTTCLSGVVSADPIFEPANVGLLFSLPGPAWFRSMVTIAGTTNIDWMVRTLCPDLMDAPDLYKHLEAIAANSPPGARGVLYHPYLSDLGIIAPVVAPELRGQFSGLTPDISRADLVRAVYEGVAFAIRDCYAALPRAQSIVLAGGGARSAFWAQIIASVTGMPVRASSQPELGALGAARLAAQAIGHPLRHRADPSNTVLEPAADQRPVYDERFARFQQMRQRMMS